MAGIPSRRDRATRLAQQTRPEGRGHVQYRGFKRRLHLSEHPRRLLHHGIFGTSSMARSTMTYV
jgi:hypothetical protein